MQFPDLSPRWGYWKAPHRCSTELPSILCFLEQRGPRLIFQELKRVRVSLGLERKTPGSVLKYAGGWGETGQTKGSKTMQCDLADFSVGKAG